jgi:hypothetical protein
LTNRARQGRAGRPGQFEKENRNKINKKVKSLKKKLKHEPSLKKPGGFTMSEGHGHPLVVMNISTSWSYHFMALLPSKFELGFKLTISFFAPFFLMTFSNFPMMNTLSSFW